MGVFLLVHGACHGGWCWRKVSALLRAQGHEVLTPTLTGLGERKHLRTDSIGLNTHIEDISNVLFYEDLEQVILVGHSYAGMVITGVANHAPDQIRHLVYLDADTPIDGQTLSDLHAESVKRIVDLATERGDHVILPPSGESPYGVTENADLEWLMPRLVPHPIGDGALTTKVSFNNPRTLEIPKVFINCTMRPDDDRRRSLVDRGFQYVEIRTGHDAMVTAPHEVAELLNDCAHGTNIGGTSEGGSENIGLNG